MLLSRDQILQSNDLATEDVTVPAWGGTVRVRAMTGRERDAFSESLTRDESGNADFTDYRAKLVAKCAVDESGVQIFTEDDVIALGGKNAFALAAVFEVADRLNRIGAEAIEDARKN